MPICHSRDFLLFLVCSVLLFLTIRNWNQYESCYAPTHIFMIETISLIFAHRALDILKDKPFISLPIKRVLAVFINIGLNTMFIGVTVQGFIWQGMNAAHEPNCNILDKTSWTIWTLLGCLVVMDLGILFYAISYLIILKKFRDFRRRQANATEAQIIGEYINGRITQVFLSGNLADDNGERVGLSYDDIQRIPRRSAGSCSDGRHTEGEGCPVCYEEFKIGEEICSLPGCSHVFHWKCIHGWFVMSPLCPMCRSNVKYHLGETLTTNNSVISSLNSFDIERQGAERV